MKGFKKSILTIFIILTIILSSIMIIDSVSAEDNPPKGFETYYMRGYGFNVPSSYKLISEGYDEVNHLNYMNFQKGKNFANISLERHSNSFNKQIMDDFTSFKLNDEKLLLITRQDTLKNYALYDLRLLKKYWEGTLKGKIEFFLGDYLITSD